MGLATQRVDVAKLLVALLRVDMAGDQRLAQGTTTKTRSLQERRGRVAADLVATMEQFVRHSHRFQMRPTDAFVGGTAGAVHFENLFEHLLQSRLALRYLRSASPGSSDTFLIATGTARMVGVVVAHRLQFANPGVDRSPAHAQDPRHISNAAEADLQRFDRGVAAPVVLRQRTAIDPHGVFVRLFVTSKLVHGTVIKLS
jgi:hypothetical protein